MWFWRFQFLVLLIISVCIDFFFFFFFRYNLILGFPLIFWDPNCLNDLHMLILFIVCLLCLYLIFQSSLLGCLKIWSSCVCPISLLLIWKGSFNEEFKWAFVLWKYSMHLWFLWVVEWSSHESSYRRYIVFKIYKHGKIFHLLGLKAPRGMGWWKMGLLLLYLR